MRTLLVIVLSAVMMSLSACVSVLLPYLSTPTPQPTVERSIETLDPDIALQPVNGYAGTYVNVRGTGWGPTQIIVIYVEDENGRSGAVASGIVDESGQFSTGFLYPVAERWLSPGARTIVASSVNEGIEMTASFAVIPPANVATSTPTVTGTSTPTPSNTPTASNTPTPTDTGMPTPTLDPIRATAQAIATLLTPEPTETVAADASATPQPSVVIVQSWRGDYWPNPDLAGPPTLIRDDPAINFDWGLDSPAPEIPVDQFSARWTRTEFFEAGLYRFVLRVDDGARLYIDDQMVLNEWRIGAVRTVAVDRQLSQGNHTIVLEYFDDIQNAVIQLEWEPIEQFSGWRGEYFTNRSLDGAPFVVRNDQEIDFQWGLGSPMPGMPEERYSVRWVRTVPFDGGVYRFFAEADDGVRFWIDDVLLLDEWRDQAARVYSVATTVAPGTHALRVEYYENTQNAQMRFWWTQEAAPTLLPSAQPLFATPTASLAASASVDDRVRRLPQKVEHVFNAWSP